MSGYPYGNNPQYPQLPQEAPFYPGFVYPYQQQPGLTVQPTPVAPASLSYPTVTPTAPQYGAYPAVTPTPPQYGAYPVVTPQPAMIVEWIPTTPANARSLSDKAIVAGYEGHDGSPLWVIRARFEGDVIPGKLAIKHNVAYVPWGGRENVVQNIEVCCARPERIRWVQSSNGNVPPNAVVGGNTSSGEPLYVGRVKQQGSLTPGKVHPSHRNMYISFAGQEVPHNQYEVLCTV